MSENHPSSRLHLPLSLVEVVEVIRSLTSEELFRWLATVIDESSPEAMPFPSTWTRYTALAMLYRTCDLPLQLRFSDAFARLLESFEPRPQAASSDRRYLLSLLSLAATARSDRAKKRLYRWLYLELFRDWEEKPFNLHGELILATAAYDPDDEWVEYVSMLLPTRPFFDKVARPAFRALLQTRAGDCLKLLPAILKVLPPDEEDERVQFGYLLSLAIDRCGFNSFLTKAIEALSSARLTVAQTIAAVSFLDRFLSETLENSDETASKTVRDLTSSLWQPAIEKWWGMKDEDNYRTFVEILESCHDYYTIIPQALVKDALGALTFRGRYELVVPTNFGHLALFFKDYGDYEDANKPLARAAGAAAGNSGPE